jgi:prefoldin subunit 5
MTEGNWYDNKTLYEMLQEVKEDISGLRREMAETRTMIRDYNDIRKKVEDTSGKINTLMWIAPIAVAATGLLLTFLNFLLKG